MTHLSLKSNFLGNICQRFSVLAIILLPFLALATDIPHTTGWKLEVPIPGLPPVITEPADYIGSLYIAAAMIAGILAVGVIVYAGFLWMTSPAIAKVEEAKGKISAAIAGVILLLASYLILNTINPDLVNLKLGSVDFGNVGNKNPLNITKVGGTPDISGPSSGESGGGSGGKVQAGPAGKGYVSLKSLGLPFTGCCTNCWSDKINEGFVPIAKKLYQACGGSYLVTCAYSPGAGHSKSSRHYSGMALDIVPKGGGFASLRACIQKAGLGGNLNDESRSDQPHFHISDTGR